MRATMVGLAVLSVVVVTPMAAQGGGYGNDRQRLRSPGDELRLPTVVQLAGPMTPETLRQLLNLDSTQVAAIAPLFAEHLEATKTVRDSTIAQLDLVPETFRKRDRAVLSRLMRYLKDNTKVLEKADKTFEEKQLKPILSKDQWNNYKRYKKDRLKAAEEEQKDRLGRVLRPGQS